MLFTLSRSPFHCDLAALLRTTRPGDDLLLLQDGVIAALSGGAALGLLRSAPISVYALREDVEARGLSEQISTDIECVSYTDFVRLAVNQRSQMAW
ncbi:sulfurtransferase complex subunit TusB [Erwinia sp. CPCC 100877]|nr:sulfurtransferase complex subunit TusB [Erwinia sp. CPCC 100877]